MPLTPLLGSIEEEDGKKSTSSPSSPVDNVEEEIIRRRKSAPNSSTGSVAAERKKRRSLGSAIKNAIIRTSRSPDTSHSLCDANRPSKTEGDDVGTRTRDAVNTGNRLGGAKTAIDREVTNKLKVFFQEPLAAKLLSSPCLSLGWEASYRKLASFDELS